MATFRFTGHNPDRAAIRAVFKSSGGKIGRDLTRRAARVETAAKQLVGVQSGRLRATIRRERGANGSGAYIHIVAGRPGRTPYLGHHLFGTVPHIIRPRRRKALRFVIDGQVIFAAKVNHPGTAPRPFLQEALAAAK